MDHYKIPAPARFGVIAADPPWSLYQTGKYGAGEHYDLMTDNQILGLGDAVKALSSENAHLYLWVTNATIDLGFDVIKAWGFEYRSILTWIKPRLGLGNYLRNSTEHILFATRGRAPVVSKSQPTWGFYPVMQHSVKPDEAYAVIDRVSGKNTTKLELFARRRPPAPNWWVWGNEIDSDVSLASFGYPVPSDFEQQEPNQTDTSLRGGGDG